MKAKLVLSRILSGRAHTLAIAAIVGFAGLILGLQRGPSGPDNIIIKDAKGQKRIEIGVFDDKPAIFMYDGKGRQCIRFGIRAEEGDNVAGTLQFFRDEDSGDCTAELLASHIGGEEGSGLSLRGHHDSSMTIEAGPMPQIELRGGGEPGEKGRLTMNMPGGLPRISMEDNHGKQRLIFRVAGDGSPHLICQDKAEKTVWQAPPEAEKPSSDKPKKEK
jgi:hypothetical protein